MGPVFAALGGLLLFVGASCAVAELLLIAIGGADPFFTLRDLWTSLRLPGLGGAAAGDGATSLATAPIAWLTALPSWLVFAALGGLLMLGRGRGRERPFG